MFYSVWGLGHASEAIAANIWGRFLEFSVFLILHYLEINQLATRHIWHGLGGCAFCFQWPWGLPASYSEYLGDEAHVIMLFVFWGNEALIC